MQKELLGIKRTCMSCQKRFYDLQRSPIMCPYCGVELVIHQNVDEKDDKDIDDVTKNVAPAVISEDALDDIETDDIELDDSDDEDFLETELDEDNDVSEFISTTVKKGDEEEDLI